MHVSNALLREMDILPQIIINSLIAGSIYALVTVGFNLIYRTTKFFNFAHGSIAIAGGYATYFLYVVLGGDIYLSVLIGVAFAGLLGYVSDIFVFGPLRRKKSSHMIFMVASLGIMIVIQSVISILFSSQFRTLSGTAVLSRKFMLLSGVVTLTQSVIFLCALLIAGTLVVVLKATMLGKTISAISDSEEIATNVGIDSNRIIGYVFILGSSIAGIAGILVGFDTGINPTMGMGLLLKGIIASIVGGVGNVYGGVLAAFFLGLVENFGIWHLSGEWKDALSFSVFIIFLFVRPQGMFGKK
jgi:branched-chain amino acid transport system permease protein